MMQVVIMPLEDGAWKFTLDMSAEEFSEVIEDAKAIKLGAPSGLFLALGKYLQCKETTREGE